MTPETVERAVGALVDHPVRFIAAAFGVCAAGLVLLAVTVVVEAGKALLDDERHLAVVR